MPTCSEIEHTETRVMEGISGEFIWNEQSGMPPGLVLYMEKFTPCFGVRVKTFSAHVVTVLM